MDWWWVVLAWVLVCVVVLVVGTWMWWQGRRGRTAPAGADSSSSRLEDSASGEEGLPRWTASAGTASGGGAEARLSVEPCAEGWLPLGMPAAMAVGAAQQVVVSAEGKTRALTVVPVHGWSSDASSSSGHHWFGVHPRGTRAERNARRARTTRLAAACEALQGSLREEQQARQDAEDMALRMEALVGDQQREIDALNAQIFELTRAAAAAEGDGAVSAKEVAQLKAEIARLTHLTESNDAIRTRTIWEADHRDYALAESKERVGRLEKDVAELKKLMSFRDESLARKDNELEKLSAALHTRESAVQDELYECQRKYEKQQKTVERLLSRLKRVARASGEDLDDVLMGRPSEDSLSLPHAASSASPAPASVSLNRSTSLMDAELVRETETVARQLRLQRRQLLAERERERLHRLRPDLGLVLGEEENADGDVIGLRVLDVTSGRAGEHAGLQSEDVLVRLGTVSAPTLEDMRDLVREVGKQIPCRVQRERDGERVEAELVLLVGGHGISVPDLLESLEIVAGGDVMSVSLQSI